MKKLLYQFDTDPQASVFDNVVAYDGGADHVTAYANCNADMITPLVEGAIFTRSGPNKKNTAIFVGGSDINIGDNLLDTIQKYFFEGFRVSTMLDSNGCNTTAAAAVAPSGLKSSAGGTAIRPAHMVVPACMRECSASCRWPRRQR